MGRYGKKNGKMTPEEKRERLNRIFILLRIMAPILLGLVIIYFWRDRVEWIGVLPIFTVGFLLLARFIWMERSRSQKKRVINK